MTDIITRLQDAIHLESAAIAPRTSPLIEAAKEAVGEIQRLKKEVDELERLEAALHKIENGYLGDQTAEQQFLWAQGVAIDALAYEQKPTLPTATPEQDKYFGPVKAR